MKHQGINIDKVMEDSPHSREEMMKMVLDIQDKVKVENINKEDGFMQFVFEKPLSNKGKLLMDSLVLGLKQLEKQYGVKYIKLIFEEV